MNSEVESITVNNSTVYVGGSFRTIGGQNRMGLGAIDANTGLLINWNPTVSGSVKSIVVHGNTVYIGGQFNSVGGRSRSNFAVIDATTGVPLP